MTLLIWNMRSIAVFGGDELKPHDDVPKNIRHQLYDEEEQRLEKQKGAQNCGTTRPPIYINVLLSKSFHPSPMSNNASSSVTCGPIDIPGRLA